MKPRVQREGEEGQRRRSRYREKNPRLSGDSDWTSRVCERTSEPPKSTRRGRRKKEEEEGRERDPRLRAGDRLLGFRHRETKAGEKEGQAKALMEF